MKLDGLRRSGNVEDRRGRGGKVALSGGAIIVIIIVGAIMGKSPGEVVRDVDRASRRSAPTQRAGDDRGKEFVSKVLATTEDAWKVQMPKLGKTYQEPKLVLFSDSVSSACGYASAAVGPFYCSRDRKAYLDLTFFADLHRKFGAPGDFAQAYVIAHEIGHHVQNLDGTTARVLADGKKQRGADSEAVRQELQADCYAGVWAAYAKKRSVVEVGDVDEALRAAKAIGDDTLQKRGRGKVTPETFGHGTSEQRARWFKIGMERGDPKACDTFNAKTL
jgi:uncharacterized protein